MNTNRFNKGLTLLEMMIAIGIIATIFTALLPQFVNINNSWASRQGNYEGVQNGRVLSDHLQRNLFAADRINNISDPSETNGYIEFNNNLGTTLKYAVDADNCVEFGPPGSMVKLTGPVNQFQLKGYDLSDLSTPITDTFAIRFVEVISTIINAANPAKNFTATNKIFCPVSIEQDVPLTHWPLDETSGLVAADSGASNYNGILTGMAGNEWVNGVLGGALYFNGNNQYIQTSYRGIGGSASRTVAFWVKTASTDDLGLLHWGNSDVNGARWRMSVNESIGSGPVGALRIDVNSASGVASTVINDGNWHHIAASFQQDSTPKIKDTNIYVDGVLETITGGHGEFDTDITSGAERVSIAMSWAGTPQCLEGTMDDVRIYNRALDAAEIAKLANILLYHEFVEAKTSVVEELLKLPTPAGKNKDDLLIVAIVTGGDTTADLAPPADKGWAEIDVSSCNGAVTLGVWWKNANNFEPITHKFTWTGDQHAYGWMMRFTGHDFDDPVDQYRAKCEFDATPKCRPVITNLKHDIILRLGAFDGSNIIVDSTGLDGHNEITMDSDETGAVSGGAGFFSMPDITTTDAAYFSLTAAGDAQTITISIRPDPDGGGQ